MAIKVPRYCRHKRSGQAYMTVKGKFIYLGPHGTHESIQRYAAMVAELQVNGTIVTKMDDRPTVRDLVNGYQAFLKEHRDARAVAAGRRTTRELVEMYGSKAVADFTPMDLLVLQNQIAQSGLCRPQVNRLVREIRRVFKWGVSRGVCDVVVFQALQSVEGLRRGRTVAPEGRKVLPVSEETVNATLPFLSRPVAGLVELLLATGARPGELVGLRAVDIDTTGPVWSARLDYHKNAWRGDERTLHFGPRAQAVLRPLMLRRPVNEPLFSPRDHLDERREDATVHRRPNQKPSPRDTGRVVGDTYTPSDLSRAVHRAVAAANRARAAELGRPLEPHEILEDWHVYRLRHTAATRFRREFGIEAARVSLGHKDAGITLTYAEQDRELAARVASRLG